MLLQGSSARVLQCSPFPTGTGAVFNSFSKQSCLHTNCSLFPYLCPVGCFREILFKQTRNCHWNPLPGRMKVPDFLSIQEWNSVMYILGQFEKQFSHSILNVNTGNGIQLCIFWVGCHPSDSDLAIQFVDWCKWLVYVASLLAPKPHLLLYLYWLAWIFRKPCHGAFRLWRTCFLLQKKHRQQQHPIPFDAVAMKATASFIREKIIQDAW